MDQTGGTSVSYFLIQRRIAMQTNELPMKGQTPTVCPGNYSPVTVTARDTVGAFFLGMLTLILLIGWRRAETRYRKLMEQKEIVDEK
jgi:hypothetical protein